MGLCLGKQRQPELSLSPSSSPQPPSSSPPPPSSSSSSSSLWSDLPAELAGLVLCRLQSHSDRLGFRAVCRRWRLAAKQQYPLPPALPCLRLNDTAFQSLPDGKLHHCTSMNFLSPVCISDGWLLCVQPAPAKVYLKKPFSKATIEMVFLPDNCVRSLGGFFAMTQLCKMVVRLDDDLVAAIFDGSDICFYRPGAPSWLVCPNDRRRGQYVDIAFHHDKLYALTTKEELFAFEAGDGKAGEVSRASHVERAIKEVQPPATNREQLLIKRYLVTSSGRLLMVKLIDRDDDPFRFIVGPRVVKKINVMVFEAELTKGQWVEVKKLDDGQALFVSRGCSKAILMSGHDGGFQGNRVYFLGVDLFTFCTQVKPSKIPNYFFYDMSTCKCSAVFLNRGGNTRDLYNAEWFFPSM